MVRYLIAGIIIDFNTDSHALPEEFALYISDCTGAADCSVDFQQCSEIALPHGKLLYEDVLTWHAHEDNVESISVCLSSPLYPGPVCKLTATKDWQRIVIRYIQDMSSDHQTVLKFFTNIIIRNLVLFHQGIVLHASSVQWQGKGIVFTAPAGTGKSTHAKMWESFLGADIINDDTPIIKLSSGNVMIHGSPWCGSGLKHKNASAPMAGIFVLEQSHENTLCRLQEQQLPAYLLPRFLLPYQDRELMERALDCYARIIASTPVYLLRCRPDQEAVELVRNVIVSE